MALLTTDSSASRLHAVGMFFLSTKRMLALLKANKRYTSVAAFKPTGWSLADAEGGGGGGPGAAGVPVSCRRSGPGGCVATYGERALHCPRARQRTR